MSVRYLELLFAPRSVAVVGASTTPRSVGAVVMRNMLDAGFEGPIMPVNPKHQAIAGVLAYPDVTSLPIVPDLAVICTPRDTVPGIVRDLGKRGCFAAVVLSAGFAREESADGPVSIPEVQRAAGEYGMRILGPNCFGVLVPAVGLNTTFAVGSALPGKIAFVSQSGALCAGVLDWANEKGVGFSHFVTLGDQADIDFGDVLDYFGGDPRVDGILLYIESIDEPRKFVSAARAAARNKPVIAVKSGRFKEGAHAAFSHTGALAASDEVYNAVIRRTGMVRVHEIDELFDAVETLARMPRLKGDRLAIVTNGGGPGVMATDTLIALRGTLAEFHDDTIRKLDALLPAGWSGRNPVDVVGDSSPERFRDALRIALEDDGCDAVLAIHVPTAMAPSVEAAEAVIPELQCAKKGVLTNWLGGSGAERARDRFANAGIATYDTPDKAIHAFMHMVDYNRNQEQLMETPPSIPSDFEPDVEAARALIADVLNQGRNTLTEPESKSVLHAYGLPIVETVAAGTPEDAQEAAERIRYPVVLKILARNVTHKSDIGGVALNLANGDAVLNAAAAIQDQFEERFPEAEFDGFSVQPMVEKSRAHELFIGAKVDPVFGPVIVFGEGGKAVEVIRDYAIALPPLNVNLAAELVSRTRVSNLLKGYRDVPPVDEDALYLALVQVSQLLIDLPEVVEFDINPILADGRGVVVLDARIKVEPATGRGEQRLAIRPYPKEIEEEVTLRSGLPVLLRPIRPEDEAAHQELFAQLTPEDIYFRFFGGVRRFPHSQMARFTQIDYDREMAIIGVMDADSDHPQTIGVARAVNDKEGITTEFAIVVRSDMKRQGLGRILLEKLIRCCRDRGLKTMTGQILAENDAMLRLAEKVGFKQVTVPERGVAQVALDLAETQF